MDRWMRMFHLLQDAEGNPGDGGTGGGDGGDPPEPKTKPKSAAGDGGDPKPPPSFSVDVLPEELRDRPEEEVRFLLTHMVDALGERNNQVESLKEQIAELRGAVSNAPKPEPEPDPYEGKALEELILEDTGAAIDKYLEQRGYARGVNELGEQVGEATMAMMAGQLDDFDEYEDTVRAILKKSNLRMDRQNIMGAYTMAVGQKTLTERQRNGRKGAGGIPPSSPPPEGDPKDEPKLSKLEQEIARAHNMTPEDWVKSRDSEDLGLKLPT